jgi:hypothetical protein
VFSKLTGEAEILDFFIKKFGLLAEMGVFLPQAALPGLKKYRYVVQLVT